MSAGIADEIDEPAQWSVRPLALGVIRVVPAVVAPVIRADDDVGFSIAVEVHITPEIPPHRI